MLVNGRSWLGSARVPLLMLAAFGGSGVACSGGSAGGSGANLADDDQGGASGDDDQGGSAGTTAAKDAGTKKPTGDAGKGAADAATSGDAGSGGPASADAAAQGPVRGCGQGTTCTPGSDLAPPAAADGYQIVAPSSISVAPGQEVFLCYYKTLPNTAEVDVGSIQSYMAVGSSHHFILYQGTVGAHADGSLQDCLITFGNNWLYATSTPGEVIRFDMPTGVGVPMPTGTQLILNMHFINPGSTTIHPTLKVNVLFAKNVTAKAKAMVSYNTTIRVPPAGATGPGTQTVSGTCNAPLGAKFFAMTTHTHKFMTTANMGLMRGGVASNLVHSTDWEHPDVALWSEPSFLTVQAGDSFTYDCSYANPTSAAITVGETAAKNEMCMGIGYYFPAGSDSCK